MSQILEKVPKIKKDGASETTILADTNVLLQLGQDIDALNKNGWKIAVTRSILMELRKLDPSLYFYACTNFEVINDSTEEIATEAGYIFTHIPDNFLIATAKVKGFPLISYDRVLLKVALSQGVEAYIPEVLIKHKRILDGTLDVPKVISKTRCTNIIFRGSENIDNEHYNELVLVETQRKEDGEVVQIYRSQEGI